jgi:hypothetical protein
MIGLAGVLFAAGCDFSEMNAPAVSAECRQIGQHCQLATGPLGVCLDAPCKPGQTPPCFACTPQH